MKKIILLAFLAIFLLPYFVQAQVIPDKLFAISHNHIEANALKENKTLSFQSIDEYLISDTEYIEKNSIVTVRIKQYVDPKRGKRNGYLKVQLVQYTTPSKENTCKIVEDKNITGTLRLSTKKDLKEIAKSAGVSVAGKILKIPGFSQAVAVSKGLIKPNENQNRLQSAGTNLYESTPLTYAEKGVDMNIEEDAIVVMKLKTTEIDE